MDDDLARVRRSHAAILGRDADEGLVRLVRDLDAMSSLGSPPASLRNPLRAPEAYGRLRRTSASWSPAAFPGPGHRRERGTAVGGLPHPIQSPVRKLLDLTVLAAPLAVLLLVAVLLLRESNSTDPAAGGTFSPPAHVTVGPGIPGPAIVVHDHGVSRTVRPGEYQYESLVYAADDFLRNLPLPPRYRVCDCDSEIRSARMSSDAFELTYPEPGLGMPDGATYTRVLIVVHGSTRSDAWGEVFLGDEGGYKRYVRTDAAGSTGVLSSMDVVRAALDLEPLSEESE